MLQKMKQAWGDWLAQDHSEEGSGRGGAREGLPGPKVLNRSILVSTTFDPLSPQALFLRFAASPSHPFTRHLGLV